MAHIIELPTHTDARGSLTVLEKVIPFSINRLYWIYDLKDNNARGQHRHLKTWQALVCLQGKCEVFIKKGPHEQTFLLDKPNHALLLEPQDWHEMKNFQDNCLLLVLASHHYDAADYVKTPL